MIANNCKGLPLTVVLIAGLLRTKRDLSWWNKISEAVSSNVLTEDGMSVLEFSYQHLPEHLKPCFLYFGSFVEDKLIRVNKLMLLWIAEGFVLISKRGNLENVAREYLNDLVDRSLVIANKRSSYGGIKSCQIHDLVHEFCQRKAQEENIFQLKVNNEASNSSFSTLRNPYRLCIHAKGKELDARNVCPSICSLLYRDHDGYDPSNLKLVQVVDLKKLLDDAYFMRESHSVGNLRCMSISRFPTLFISNNFLSNCWNLEIIIVGESRYKKFPEAFWNMTRLRYVDVEMCSLSKRELPCPQMVNLESFSSLRVSSTEKLEDLLQGSPSLRKLSFYGDDDGIHLPKVDSLSKLESLKVECVGETCLHSFNLLSSLKKLSLTDCDVDWRDLSVISKLPCLEVLKLLEDSIVGPEWDMDHTNFPKLKFMKLQKLEMVEWTASVESFPSIKVLIVERCHWLNRIPPCFGEMLTLKRIQVYSSHKSVGSSIVEIQEAQKDFGNEELQVIFSSIGLFESVESDEMDESDESDE